MDKQNNKTGIIPPNNTLNNDINNNLVSNFSQNNNLIDILDEESKNGVKILEKFILKEHKGWAFVLCNGDMLKSEQLYNGLSKYLLSNHQYGLEISLNTLFSKEDHGNLLHEITTIINKDTTCRYILINGIDSIKNIESRNKILSGIEFGRESIMALGKPILIFSNTDEFYKQNIITDILNFRDQRSTSIEISLK